MVAGAFAKSYDAIVVGAGPNGLTAGVLLARAGLSVLLLEASDEPGGGCRSAELTLPGFINDICSAVHPMGMLSPVFRDIGLERYGLSWVPSDLPLAHPLPDGGVAVLHQLLDDMVCELGADAQAWTRMLAPFMNEPFIHSLLNPVWRPDSGLLLGGVENGPAAGSGGRSDRHDSRPAFLAALAQKARFGLTGLRSAESVARSRFQGGTARALFAGCAAHSAMALDRAGTAAFGLVLAAAAHAADWPCAQGGSREITRALVRAFERFGGVLQTGMCVTRFSELPRSKAVFFDLSPRQVAAICADELPPAYAARLRRFRHGPGVFKIDWALDGPIPWRNPECARAMTVHVGGSFEDVLRAEGEVAHGRAAEKPFVIVAQQSMFDPTRCPAGRQTGWAYCHVPNGCAEDMTGRIETAIEPFAPGFRDRILARHSMNPAQFEAHNATMIGGDISGGANDLRQVLFRPIPRWDPYATPNPRIFLCSSSTPPGGGVHGMCGYHAARRVLTKVFCGPRVLDRFLDRRD